MASEVNIIKVLVVVIAAAVSVVYAGVQPITEDRAREATRLWQKFCSGSGSRGREGSTFVYCKIGNDAGVQELEHPVTLRPSPDAGNQVVFVKPPSKKYNHKVIITGQPGGKQQATIYVLPQKDEHNVEVIDEREEDSEPEKPHLYFLNESPDAGSPSDTYLPPKNKASGQAQRPKNTYLPPRKTPPSTGEGYTL